MIILVFMLFKCLFVMVLLQCSIDGIRGLVGCECKFIGVCNVYEIYRVGLNIVDYLLKGLELYGYCESVLINRNLVYLCEGEIVVILFDCNSCILFYVVIVIIGSQLNLVDCGG